MLTTTVHLFTLLINMNQSVIFHLNDGNEIKKDNMPLSFIDGTYDQQDKQLCEYFHVDYQQVRSIELL